MVHYSHTSRRSSSSSSSSSSELDSAFKGASNQSQMRRQTHKEKQALQKQDEEITQILKECGQEETSYIKRVVATHPLPPVNTEFQEGWCYITKNKFSGKTIMYVHKLSSRGQVNKEMSLNEKMAIVCETSYNNWQRYREQYDSIHGEGQYEIVYTCKNSSESDDDDDDDDESEATD